MKKVTFKEYQKILMNSFKTINEFFISENIKWWAHSGTLLGAARDGDIIDWDDDIDMSMTIYDWVQNRDKISKFLEEMNWEAYDSIETRALDATRFFSNEYLIVEYDGSEYLTKPFIDVMLSVPKNKISLPKRKMWSWFNQYNFIFSSRYRLLPYYGWFGHEVKKIGSFTNFLVFLQKIILYPITFWIPIVQKIYLRRKSYFSENVAMYYNYDNNGVIYNINKLNTKHKFGETEVYSSDDWENELNIWFGKDKWKELPDEWNRVPHHIVLTKLTRKTKNKYKINPYIII